MKKKANHDVEDVTFMDHTQELINIEDREYTESQAMADTILLFLTDTDTTSIYPLKRFIIIITTNRYSTENLI